MVSLQTERYKEKTPLERRLFYTANREEMVADLQLLGNKAFLEKWPVAPQVIAHLKHTKGWVKLHSLEKSPQRPSTNGLPPLPAFSDSWSKAVQLKWLEVWRQTRN